MYPYHHPGAQRVLELPVYRCTEEQYLIEQEARFQFDAQYIKQAVRRLGKDPDTAKEVWEFRENWFHHNRRLWDFNEVVAWIRVYARPGSIGASLFITNKRVSRTMSNKKFVWDSWNFLDIGISKNQSNCQIFDDLREAILSASGERFKGRRYVDIGIFDALGPYVDWITLTRRPIKDGR